MNGRQSRAAGFTVLELLIASAIFMILLGALTSYFVTSNKAMAVTETLSNRQQEVEAAVNVLSYDLGLAGYKGVTPAELARTFPAPTLAVEKAVLGESDRLVIRYFEDSGRLYGAANTCGSPCVVTYEVDYDDKGETNLYRQEGNDPERGIVQRVDHFKVTHYILRSGSFIEATPGSTPPVDLAGLNIELAFATGGIWRFPVGISNVQEN
jgi:Tfp pilus assembly protein PilW